MRAEVGFIQPPGDPGIGAGLRGSVACVPAPRGPWLGRNNAGRGVGPGPALRELGRALRYLAEASLLPDVQSRALLSRRW